MSSRSERTARLAWAGAWAGAAVMALALAACGDPTRDALIAQLGDEDPGVPEGPLHRPGQPCGVCHDGAAARAIAIGGTVFWTVDSDAPAPGVEVRLVDEGGAEQLAITNCAGNFFVLPEELDVDMPFWVEVGAGDAAIPMDSPVNGDGSCASCHGLEPDPASAGRVYLFEIPPSPAPESCP